MLFTALNLRVPRLAKNRHGVYYVRYPSLDASGGRKVTQYSLGTKDTTAAKIRALKFCLSFFQSGSMSSFLDGIRPYTVTADGGISADGEKDHQMALEASKLRHAQQMEIIRAQAGMAALAPMAPSAGLSQTHSAPITPAGSPFLAARAAIADRPALMLKAAFADHLAEEMRSGLVEQTIGEKKVVFEEFVECFGDVNINTIAKQDVTSIWRPTELNRPNKKRAGQKLSGSRMEKRRGYLKKFFDWAIDGGRYFDKTNPMDQKMASKQQIKAATQSYADFNLDDLKNLFGPDFVAYMDKPDWYWLPLMSLMSGARLSEIAKLELKNISTIEGIPCYEIRAGKTINSKRFVPIHSVLLKLGFLDYVSALKVAGHTKLLPHRIVKKPEKSTGEMWGKWVSKCGIEDKRKVFHSFRVTAISNLHGTKAGHVAIRKTVGHVAEGATGAHYGYVRGIGLQKLRDTIEMLEFPTIDFSQIKLADPTFSAFFASHPSTGNSATLTAKALGKKNHEIAKAARFLRLSKSRKRKGSGS